MAKLSCKAFGSYWPRGPRALRSPLAMPDVRSLCAWPGELDPDIEMPDESDEEEQADTFGSGDVRELEGCVLTIANFDSRSGERSVGEEYMPGGNLVVSLQVLLYLSFLYP